MNRIFAFALFILILLIASVANASVFTTIQEIKQNPVDFEGKYVSVFGYYSGWKNAPGSPPLTRSDWVISDNEKNGIYCSGIFPKDQDTGEIKTYWTSITVLGIVKLADGKPYLEVVESRTVEPNSEKMVSIAQILFAPLEMRNRNVNVIGVLAKGYGIKGERLYILADPTGAVTLGKLPKLYPKGTILHVKGIVAADENGLPFIDNIEILSAKVN